MKVQKFPQGTIGSELLHLASNFLLYIALVIVATMISKLYLEVDSNGNEYGSGRGSYEAVATREDMVDLDMDNEQGENRSSNIELVGLDKIGNDNSIGSNNSNKNRNKNSNG